jgi:hypothetical protein
MLPKYVHRLGGKGCITNFGLETYWKFFVWKSAKQNGEKHYSRF